MPPCRNTETIANVALGLLDCKVRCSGRKTVFQSLKKMYAYCKMPSIRTSTDCRGEQLGCSMPIKQPRPVQASSA